MSILADCYIQNIRLKELRNERQIAFVFLNAKKGLFYYCRIHFITKSQITVGNKYSSTY